MTFAQWKSAGKPEAKKTPSKYAPTPSGRAVQQPGSVTTSNKEAPLSAKAPVVETPVAKTPVAKVSTSKVLKTSASHTSGSFGGVTTEASDSGSAGKGLSYLGQMTRSERAQERKRAEEEARAKRDADLDRTIEEARAELVNLRLAGVRSSSDAARQRKAQNALTTAERLKKSMPSLAPEYYASYWNSEATHARDIRVREAVGRKELEEEAKKPHYTTKGGYYTLTPKEEAALYRALRTAEVMPTEENVAKAQAAANKLTVRNQSARVRSAVQADVDELKRERAMLERQKKQTSREKNSSVEGGEQSLHTEREIRDYDRQIKDLDERIKDIDGLLGLLQEESRASDRNVEKNADFKEHSQYVSTYDPDRENAPVAGVVRPGEASEYADPTYERINRRGPYVTGSDKLALSTAELSNDLLTGVTEAFLDEMKDEEIARFNYYYWQDTQKGDPNHTTAYQYIRDLSADLNRRQKERLIEGWQKWIGDNPVKGAVASAYSVVTSPAKTLAGISGLMDMLTGDGFDGNSLEMLPAYRNAAIRGKVAENLENRFGEYVPAGWLYNATMNVLDNAYNIALSGGLGYGTNAAEQFTLALMSSEVIPDMLMDAKERGLSDGQAAALAFIGGLTEYFTEKIGMDALFNFIGGNGANLARYLAKNALAEGSEELISGIVNPIADYLVSLDKSEIMRRVKEYDKRMSHSGAMKKALLDELKEVGSEALAGAFSGVLMGGGGAIIGTAVQNRQQNSEMGKDVSEAQVVANRNRVEFWTNYAKDSAWNDENIATLAGEVYESAEKDTALYDRAKTIVDKAASGEQITDADRGALYAALDVSMKAAQLRDSLGLTQEAVDEAQNAPYNKNVKAGGVDVLNRGTTAYLEGTTMNEKRAAQKAAIVQKLLSGEKVTLDELKALNLHDPKYRAIFSDLTGVQFPDGKLNDATLYRYALTAYDVDQQNRVMKPMQDVLNAAARQEEAAVEAAEEQDTETPPVVEQTMMIEETEAPTEGQAAGAESVFPGVTVRLDGKESTYEEFVDRVRSFPDGATMTDRELISEFVKLALDQGKTEVLDFSQSQGKNKTTEVKYGSDKQGAQLGGTAGRTVPQRSGVPGGSRLSQSKRNDVGSGRVSGSKSSGLNAPTKITQITRASDFATYLSDARKADPVNGWAVTAKTEEDLEGHKLFLSEDSGLGFAIAGDGDIQAVFRNRKLHPKSGAVKEILPLAIENGGRKLDCYGEGLAQLYARDGGMRPVARVEFNPEYANDGWSEEKGRPYIYFMLATDTNANDVRKKQGTYSVPTKDELESLPTFGKDDYDAAYAYRDKVLAEYQARPMEDPSGQLRLFDVADESDYRDAADREYDVKERSMDYDGLLGERPEGNRATAEGTSGDADASGRIDADRSSERGQEDAGSREGRDGTPETGRVERDVSGGVHEAVSVRPSRGEEGSEGRLDRAAGLGENGSESEARPQGEIRADENQKAVSSAPQFKDWGAATSALGFDSGGVEGLEIGNDYEVHTGDADAYSVGYSDKNREWHELKSYPNTAEGLAELNADLPGLLEQVRSALGEATGENVDQTKSDAMRAYQERLQQQRAKYEDVEIGIGKGATIRVKAMRTQDMTRAMRAQVKNIQSAGCPCYIVSEEDFRRYLEASGSFAQASGVTDIKNKVVLVSDINPERTLRVVKHEGWHVRVGFTPSLFIDTLREIRDAGLWDTLLQLREKAKELWGSAYRDEGNDNYANWMYDNEILAEASAKSTTHFGSSIKALYDIAQNAVENWDVEKNASVARGEWSPEFRDANVAEIESAYSDTDFTMEDFYAEIEDDSVGDPYAHYNVPDNINEWIKKQSGQAGGNPAVAESAARYTAEHTRNRDGSYRGRTTAKERAVAEAVRAAVARANAKAARQEANARLAERMHEGAEQARQKRKYEEKLADLNQKHRQKLAEVRAKTAADIEQVRLTERMASGRELAEQKAEWEKKIVALRKAQNEKIEALKAEHKADVNALKIEFNMKLDDERLASTMYERRKAAEKLRVKTDAYSELKLTAKERRILNRVRGKNAFASQAAAEEKSAAIGEATGPVEIVWSTPSKRVELTFTKQAADALATKGRTLYHNFVSAGEAIEKLARRQVSDMRADTLLTIFGGSNATAEMCLTTGLVDRFGDTIGGSAAEVLRMTKPNGRLDVEKQKLLNEYLFLRHTEDRMSIVSRAKAAMDNFAAQNPWVAEMPTEEFARLVALTDKEAEKLGNTQARDLARTYEELRERYVAAEDLPVLGDQNRVPITAEFAKQEADRFEQENPWLKEKAEEIYAWWDTFMRTWAVGDLLTESDYEAMRRKYPHYVPTYRVKKAAAHSGVTQQAETVSPRPVWKPAIGSVSELMPIEDSFTNLITQTINASRANDLLKNIIYTSMLDESGLFSDMVQFVDSESLQVADDDEQEAVENRKRMSAFEEKDGHYYLTARDNGEILRAEVSEELFRSVRDSLNLTDRGSFEEFAVRLGNLITGPMKMAITGINPRFAIRNVIRDQMTANVNSISGLAFSKYLTQAVGEIFKDSENWQRFQALGGTSSSYYNNNRGLEAAVRKGNGFVGKSVKALSTFNDVTEAMTRFAEYLATIDKLGDTPEARLTGIKNAAEVTVDFGRRGRYGALINAWVPYWNPAVQGIDKLFRSVFQTGDVKQSLKTLGRAGLLHLLPEVLTYVVVKSFKRDKDWEELTDRMRDTYYCIPIPSEKKFLKIPKNREWAAILGTPLLRILEGIDGRANPFESYIETSLTPNFLPPSILGYDADNKRFTSDMAILDLYSSLSSNKDFAGRTIVPYAMQRSEPRAQYDVDTSYLARWIGDMFNFSPEQIDYVLEDYFGDFYGTILTGLSEAGISKAQFWKMAPEEIWPNVQKIMSTGWIADSRYSNRYVSEYYDTMEALEEKTAGQKLHSGPDAPKTEDQELLAAMKKLYGNQISDWAKEAGKLEDGLEKDQLKGNIARMAKEAMEFYRGAKNGTVADPALEAKYYDYPPAIAGELKAMDPYSETYDFEYKEYKPSSYVDPSSSTYEFRLTDDEKAQYQAIRQDTYTEFILKVIDSDLYKKADPEKKAQMLEGAASKVSDTARKRFIKRLKDNGRKPTKRDKKK